MKINKEEVLAIRVSDIQKEALKQRAKSRGLSMSKYVLERVFSKPEPMHVNTVLYNGIWVHINIEVINEELLVTGRFEKDGKELKANSACILGHTFEDALMLKDNEAAKAKLNDFFSSMN